MMSWDPYQFYWCTTYFHSWFVYTMLYKQFFQLYHHSLLPIEALPPHCICSRIFTSNHLFHDLVTRLLTQTSLTVIDFLTTKWDSTSNILFMLFSTPFQSPNLVLLQVGSNLETRFHEGLKFFICLITSWEYFCVHLGWVTRYIGFCLHCLWEIEK